MAARYGPSNGWLDDQIAITVRAYEGGLVYYVGTYLDDAAQHALITHMAPLAGVRRAIEDVPAGVEVRVRTNPEGTDSYLVINHEAEERSLELPWPVQEHLTGESAEGELVLGPYGVALLTKSP